MLPVGLRNIVSWTIRVALGAAALPVEEVPPTVVTGRTPAGGPLTLTVRVVLPHPLASSASANPAATTASGSTAMLGLQRDIAAQPIGSAWSPAR
jgi:hypothetical protein